MKIAVVSDTHDNLKNLEKFIEFCKKERVKILIHCGDVCGGETLEKIEESFEKIYLSLGNADIEKSIRETARKTKIFEKNGKIKIKNLRIGFCHKFDLKEQGLKLKNLDFFFFGHTHWPYFKKEENCILANPGNLAGIYYKATFALLETKTKNLELKILENL